MTIKQATPTRVAALATLMLSLGALVAVALMSAQRADAVTAAKATSLWNQQRKMHGIPAGLTNNPTLSDGCRKHNDYQRQNGLGHDEIEGNPGYTPEGDAAGNSSVLGVGGPPWNTLNRNPWENAPIHLSQMLDPWLKVTGYDESFGYFCATTLSMYRPGYSGRPRPASSKLFTYPGPGVKHYRAQEARESPFTPGQLVGIAQGARTGPYIYVLIFADADAEWDATADITRASLKSPSGRKLAVKVVDETNDQIANYIPPGGFIIPRRALKAGKRYTAHVEVKFEGQTFRRTWRFRTNRRVVGALG